MLKKQKERKASLFLFKIKFNFFLKLLTNFLKYIILLALSKFRYGGIAQLARAIGSYPAGHKFKSYCRYQNLLCPMAKPSGASQTAKKQNYMAPSSSG